MADAADAALSDQERGAAGVAAPGRGTPPTGSPTPGSTGPTARAGWAFADAAMLGLARPVRPAGHAAAMASRPGSAPLDLSTPPRPPHSGGGDPVAGAAAGQGELDVGLPPHPRRVVPHRGQHRMDHPPPCRCCSSAWASATSSLPASSHRPVRCRSSTTAKSTDRSRQSAECKPPRRSRTAWLTNR
jgi:hypothetical protein